MSIIESPDKSHIVFFHGLGDNYKKAKTDIEWFCDHINKQWSTIFRADLYSKMSPDFQKRLQGMPIISDVKFIGHANEYPKAFQHYIAFCVASFLFLGASVLLPILLLCTTSIPLFLAFLIFLFCLLVSTILIIVPFIHKEQDLYISSIQKIEQLLNSGVNSRNIILFGHSFGGAMGLEVLKYFLNEKKRELGGVIVDSTFSSFEKVIQSSPVPQAKLLSILPFHTLKNLLKFFNLDYNLSDTIKSLSTNSIPITIIDSGQDKILLEDVRLGYVIQEEIKEDLSQGSSIKILYHDRKSHCSISYDDVESLLLEYFPPSTSLSTVRTLERVLSPYLMGV